MLKRGFLIGAAVYGAIALSGAAFAQSESEAIMCWSDYADCARQSGGDENWRSICYADFTDCIGQKPLQPCTTQGRTRMCVEFHAECKQFIEGSAELAVQCADDKDACELAHGC